MAPASQTSSQAHHADVAPAAPGMIIGTGAILPGVSGGVLCLAFGCMSL